MKDNIVTLLQIETVNRVEIKEEKHEMVILYCQVSVSVQIQYKAVSVFKSLSTGKKKNYLSPRQALSNTFTSHCIRYSDSKIILDNISTSMNQLGMNETKFI